MVKQIQDIRGFIWNSVTNWPSKTWIKIHFFVGKSKVYFKKVKYTLKPTYLSFFCPLLPNNSTGLINPINPSLDLILVIFSEPTWSQKMCSKLPSHFIIKISNRFIFEQDQIDKSTLLPLVFMTVRLLWVWKKKLFKRVSVVTRHSQPMILTT